MDTNFDPDAYLAAKDAPFDPDAYIASKAPTQAPIESAARGALRNFPMGQQAAAAIAPVNPWADKGDYSQELSHLTEAAEQGKKQNPKSYYAGAAAGSVAPLLIPGAGEALEAAPILGNAALGALGSVSDTNVVKNPGQAAGEAALGAGIGAAVGGIGKLLSKAAPAAEGAAEAAPQAAPGLAEKAVGAIPTPTPSLAPRAAKPAPGTLDGLAVPNRSVAPDFVPSADRVYASNLARGMGGTPRQLMKVFGKKDPVQEMVKIGNWMEKAGPEGKSISGLLDRPGELLDKVSAIHDASGKSIGKVIDSLGNSRDIDTPALIEELRDFADRTADPATEGRILKMIKVTENNLKKGIGDFDNLQQIKGMAGEQIKKDPEMSLIYGHLADKLNDIVEAHGAAIQDPKLAAQYAKAKLDYSNSSRLLPMLRYAEAKDLVGGPGGHHTLRGLLASIFNMATAMTGLPPAEQLGKNVMLKAAPISRQVVNAGSQTRNAVVPAALGGGKKWLSPAAQVELTNALSAMYGKKER